MVIWQNIPTSKCVANNYQIEVWRRIKFWSKPFRSISHKLWYIRLDWVVTIDTDSFSAVYWNITKIRILISLSWNLWYYSHSSSLYCTFVYTTQNTKAPFTIFSPVTPRIHPNPIVNSIFSSISNQTYSMFTYFVSFCVPIYSWKRYISI